MNRPLLAVAALSVLLAASPARAKPGAARPAGAGPYARNSLSFWGVLDPSPDGFGLGVRVALPIVPEGILHAKVRDELLFEFGGDWLHYEDRVGFAPFYVEYSWDGFLLVGGVAWNFWFTPQLALYPKLDLGFQYGWYSGWNDVYGYGHSDLDGVFLQGAVGLIYRLPKVDLRVELGSGLLRLGVGIPF